MLWRIRRGWRSAGRGFRGEARGRNKRRRGRHGRKSSEGGFRGGCLGVFGALWKRSISLSESSRERTARSMGKIVSRNWRPSGEVIVIWVEAWSSTWGMISRASLASPRSWTISASTPAAPTRRSWASAAANSSVNEWRIHGDEAFDAVFVKVGDELWEVFFGEIISA